MKDTFLIGSIPVSGIDIPVIASELNSSDFFWRCYGTMGY
jgi:hypothetical protein